MNNNTATHSTMIPHYINPVLENAHPAVSVEMTSASRDTHQNDNLNITSKISRMGKPLDIAITQGPRATIHQVQGKEVQINKEVSPDGHKERDWSSGLFACLEDWSSCK